MPKNPTKQKVELLVAGYDRIIICLDGGAMKSTFMMDFESLEGLKNAIDEAVTESKKTLLVKPTNGNTPPFPAAHA